MPKSSSKPRIPKLCRHKGKNLGYIYVDGRRIYLGPWGVPDTEREYRRVVADWIANDGVEPQDASITMVADCVLPFLEWCDRVYNKKRVSYYTCACKPLVAMFGDEPVSDFGPRKLRAVMYAHVDAGLSRDTANRYTYAVRRMFKWAASRELCRPEVCVALEMVEGLRERETDAPESVPVLPVTAEQMQAVLDIASATVKAMILLQGYTGARPGEILNLKAADIDRSGEVWVVDLSGRHKMAHKGRPRMLFIGPKAQAVLRPILLKAGQGYLFSPARAELERLGEGAKRGRSRECYDVQTYRQAIHHYCDRAGVERWNPNQLRHTLATQVRKQYGLEAAQAVLGHESVDVTQIYAEKDLEKARQIMGEIG